MSVLLNHEIKKEMKRGRIHGNSEKLNIEDFHFGPNSVDVTLGSKLLTYFPVEIIELSSGEKIVKQIQSQHTFIDIKGENKVYEIEIPEEGLILTPGLLYLGYTNEAIGSSFHIPMYEGRSSMGRLGIQSHVSAGFGDIGFDRQWTLEITVQHPVKFYPNIRIGQVYFEKISKKQVLKAIKEDSLYKGKYKNQEGAQKSLSEKDFH